MIGAYDEWGNVVDLVEWEAKIRAEERIKNAYEFNDGYQNGITRVLDILEHLDTQMFEMVKDALYEQDYQEHIKEKNMIMTEEEMDEQIELMQEETNYQYAHNKAEYLLNYCAENECPSHDNCDLCIYDKGRADKYQEITSAYMLLTEKQVEEIRAEAIKEVKSKMISFHTDAIFQYGADIIEARADAFDELRDWLEEQNIK